MRSDVHEPGDQHATHLEEACRLKLIYNSEITQVSSEWYLILSAHGHIRMQSQQLGYLHSIEHHMSLVPRSYISSLVHIGTEKMTMQSLALGYAELKKHSQNQCFSDFL